jgi:hypothetical protein
MAELLEERRGQAIDIEVGCQSCAPSEQLYLTLGASRPGTRFLC